MRLCGREWGSGGQARVAVLQCLRGPECGRVSTPLPEFTGAQTAGEESRY